MKMVREIGAAVEHGADEDRHRQARLRVDPVQRIALKNLRFHALSPLQTETPLFAAALRTMRLSPLARPNRNRPLLPDVDNKADMGLEGF